MRKNYITSESFEKIKNLLKTTRRKDVAATMGVSICTINNVAICETYDDYLIYKAEKKKRFAELENSPIVSLNGEPLFWEVHSMLRDVPNKYIKEKRPDLLIEEIMAMKKALNYNYYCENKEALLADAKRKREIYYSANEGRLPEELQREIRRRYAEGESATSLMALYDISSAAFERIIANDNPGMPKRPRSKRVVNHAIAEMILDGLAKDISSKIIAHELGISESTISRVRSGSMQFEKSRMIETYWENDALPSRLKRYHREGEDFYMFSLRRYLDIDKYPFWWKNSQQTPETPETPETIETPVEAEIVAETKSAVAEPNDKSETPAVAEVPKAIETPKAIDTPVVPVEVKRDGNNLTLTITINLNM